MNVSVGQKYIKNKEFKKALMLFSNLEKSEAKNSSIFFYLGLVYFELNKFDKSIFYYKKYLNKEPLSEAGLLNLAIAKQAIGDLKLAKDLLVDLEAAKPAKLGVLLDMNSGSSSELANFLGKRLLAALNPMLIAEQRTKRKQKELEKKS